MECRRRRNRASGPNGKLIQTVLPGEVYCSSACRKLLERFATDGGHFESPNHGVTARGGLVVPLA
jgi:hypothetical protein